MNDLTRGIDLSLLWRPVPTVYVQGDRAAGPDREEWQVQILQMSDLDSSEFQEMVLDVEMVDPAKPFEPVNFDGHARTDKYGRFGLRIGRDNLIVKARPHPSYIGINHDHKFELRKLDRRPFSTDGDPIPVLF